jgi:hypothetical protein
MLPNCSWSACHPRPSPSKWIRTHTTGHTVTHTHARMHATDVCHTHARHACHARTRTHSHTLALLASVLLCKCFHKKWPSPLILGVPTLRADLRLHDLHAPPPSFPSRTTTPTPTPLHRRLSPTPPLPSPLLPHHSLSSPLPPLLLSSPVLPSLPFSPNPPPVSAPCAASVVLNPLGPPHGIAHVSHMFSTAARRMATSNPSIVIHFACKTRPFGSVGPRRYSFISVPKLDMCLRVLGGADDHRAGRRLFHPYSTWTQRPRAGCRAIGSACASVRMPFA